MQQAIRPDVTLIRLHTQVQENRPRLTAILERHPDLVCRYVPRHLVVDLLDCHHQTVIDVGNRAANYNACGYRWTATSKDYGSGSEESAIRYRARPVLTVRPFHAEPDTRLPTWLVRYVHLLVPTEGQLRACLPG